MAKGTQAHIEYAFILVLVVAPLIFITISGLELNPDVNFQLPFSWQMKLYVYLTTYIAAIFFALFGVEYSENAEKGARNRGFTLFGVFSLIGALIGVGLIAYMILLDYQFINSEFNKWLSYYLFLGALSIFVLGKRFIFEHEAISRKHA